MFRSAALAVFFVAACLAAGEETRFKIYLTKATCLVKNEIAADEMSVLVHSFSTTPNDPVFMKHYQFGYPAIATGLSDRVYNFTPEGQVSVGTLIGNPDSTVWPRGGGAKYLGPYDGVGISITVIERDSSDPAYATRVGGEIGGQIGAAVGRVVGLPLVDRLLEWSLTQWGRLIAHELAPRFDRDDYIGTEAWIATYTDLYRYFSETDSTKLNRHVVVSKANEGSYRIDFTVERIGPKPAMENSINELIVRRVDPHQAMFTVDYTYNGRAGTDPEDLRVEVSPYPPDPAGDGIDGWETTPAKVKEVAFQGRRQAAMGRHTTASDAWLRRLANRPRSLSEVVVTLYSRDRVVASKRFPFQHQLEASVDLQEATVLAVDNDTLIVSVPYEVRPYISHSNVDARVEVLLPPNTAKGTPFFEAKTVRLRTGRNAIVQPLRWVGRGAKPAAIKVLITATSNFGVQAKRLYTAELRWP